MAKNYYAILGVLPTATLEEIRSAYRRRAKQYHPDHFGKDSAQFLNIQEAYDVLSDPANRTTYDRRWGAGGEGAASRLRPEPETIRPRRTRVEPLRRTRASAVTEIISPLHSYRTSSPSFDEIFEGLWNASDPWLQPKGERFRTLTMEVVLTPDQAIRGGAVQILLPVRTTCSACGGYGDLGSCQCLRCDGTGAGLGEVPFQVEYPPGIRDFYQVAIPLDRFGIHDICLILPFRIGSAGDFEDP
jgi:hypothetical protein